MKTRLFKSGAGQRRIRNRNYCALCLPLKADQPLHPINANSNRGQHLERFHPRINHFAILSGNLELYRTLLFFSNDTMLESNSAKSLAAALNNRTLPPLTTVLKPWLEKREVFEHFLDNYPEEPEL